MKKILIAVAILLFAVPAMAFPPVVGSRWTKDGTGLQPRSGITHVKIGNANPLSVDTDGDGDADFILGVSAPAAANSTGVAGTVFFADDFIYVCIAANTWVRVGLATWP